LDNFRFDRFARILRPIRSLGRFLHDNRRDA